MSRFWKSVILSVTIACFTGSLNAAVEVNGVPGEDSDGTSPFETLQAAVEFANNGLEDTVEITTDSLTSGLNFGGEPLNHDLTIQASPGISPVIHDALNFIPTNDANLVTLTGISVITNDTSVDTTCPLNVGCSLTAVNCTFDSNSTNSQRMAVTCAVPSAGTLSSLTLTSCTLRGFGGLETGRSCRDNILTNCLIETIPPDDAARPFDFIGVTNARNFSTRSTVPNLPRLDEAMGLTVIDQPRNVTMTNCTVHAGMPIAWPSSKDAAKWNNTENTVFGHFDATNCVFESLRSIAKPGFPSCIGNENLPPNQDINCTFKHCTFFALAGPDGGKSVNGLLYFPANGLPIVNLYNCLFDAPSTDYLIFDYRAPNAILSGDGNTYHYRHGSQDYRAIITTGSPYTPLDPPFESTQHDYVRNEDDMTSGPTFVDKNGNIVIQDPSIVNHAVDLSPAVTSDKDGDSRPMPVTASHSDIGADETDESLPAFVLSWSSY